MYQNNNIYIGATAIICKFPYDASSLEIINSSDMLDNEETWRKRTKISEIGIKYRKTDSLLYNYVVLPYPNQQFDNGGNDYTEYEVEESNHIYSIVRVSWGLYKNGVLQPARVVIRNLSANTDYDVEFYYKKEGSTAYYLIYTATIRTQSTIGACNCTNTVGGTEEQRATLQATCDEACRIYNEMGKSWTFTYQATVGGNPSGSAADDGMHFGPAYIGNLSIAVHEMAHNIMRIVEYAPDFYNGVDRKADLWNTYITEVNKFMEFASHVEGASWRWQGTHNYPVISSYNFNKVGCYLVAAGCHISRNYSEGY